MKPQLTIPNGRLIGLTGVAGSGKTTARDVLVAHDWQSVKFAGPLKAMAAALFHHAGIDSGRAIEGDMKETPLDVLQGKTPRYVMQTLGAEWGRDTIGQALWIGIAKREISVMLQCGCDVVVDDVRFQNEADLIRQMGGRIVAVIGRGGIEGGHVSEAGVSPDFALINGGTIDEFRAEVLHILHDTGWSE